MKTDSFLTRIGAIKSLLNVYLNQIQDVITEEEVKDTVKKTINMHCAFSGESEESLFKAFPRLEKELIDFIMERKYVTTQEGILLSSESKQKMEKKKAQITELKKTRQWNHWTAYCEYLKLRKTLPIHVIENIDEDTDNILKNIPLPFETSEFDIRGLVMGFVQSGKTINYSSLINKSLDLGYDIVIVLSGIPSSLRNQTQERIEHDVVGFSTVDNKVVGIGEYFNQPTNVEIYTKLDGKNHNGDFNAQRIRTLPSYNGNKPIIIVSKKVSEVLQAIKTWLASQPIYNNSSKCIDKLSLLLIDDETDNASINTENHGEKASPVNRAIRDILNLFKKKTYIGYTATPFANIFIDSDEKDDLFPRDFIYLLKPPSNYLGPFEFFGIENKDEKINALPLVRITNDLDAPYFNDDLTVLDWDYESGGLNPSLKRAVQSYLLAGAIRRLRGHGADHHSMLIHVSSRVEPQSKIRKAIQQYIDKIKEEINFKESEFWVDIHDLWSTDFLPTSGSMEDIDEQKQKKSCIFITDFPFAEIQEELKAFLSDMMDVREINGESDDELDYQKHKGEGLKVIVVGGNILSRGYTLEGLCVSYYTRFSLQCDTVLQCGRWFGYHDSYKDLIRVYTTEENEEILRGSAEVVYKLICQFERMAKEERSPKEFGFRIDEMLKGYLKPTSKKRIQKSYEVDTSFSGFSSEVAAFKIDDSISVYNQNLTEDFISSLGKPTDPKQISWRGVDALHVLDYLEKFRICRYARFHEVKLLRDYVVQAQKLFNHLHTFDIVLVNLSRGGGSTTSLGEFVIKNSERRRGFSVKGNNEYYKLSMGRALTPAHLVFGLTDFERNELETLFPKEKRTASYTENQIRAVRNNRGVLILYTFCPEIINEQLKEISRSIKFAPIGFHISLPECKDFPSRKTLVNLVYYLNDILGRNIV